MIFTTAIATMCAHSKSRQVWAGSAYNRLHFIGAVSAAVGVGNKLYAYRSHRKLHSLTKLQHLHCCQKVLVGHEVAAEDLLGVPADKYLESVYTRTFRGAVYRKA